MFEARIRLEYEALPQGCPLRFSNLMSETPRITVESVVENSHWFRRLIIMEGLATNRRSLYNYLQQFSTMFSTSLAGTTTSVYVVESTVCPLYDSISSTKCFLKSASAFGRWITLKILGQSISDIRSLVRKACDGGYPARVESISRIGAGNNLTLRQDEALHSAYKNGFFDYPHKIKLKDLAKDLNCSASTLDITLRKATKKVIANHVYLDDRDAHQTSFDKGMNGFTALSGSGVHSPLRQRAQKSVEPTTVEWT